MVFDEVKTLRKILHSDFGVGGEVETAIANLVFLQAHILVLAIIQKILASNAPNINHGILFATEDEVFGVKVALIVRLRSQNAAAGFAL